MGLEPRPCRRAYRAARGSIPERVILVRDERGRGADVTDSGWRGSEDAWWADALPDPWRDPAAPAAVVVRPTATSESVPAPEPLESPAQRRPMAPLFVMLLVTALLAGGLGGTLGYVFAQRGGAGGNRPTLGGGGGTGASGVAQRPPDSLAGAVKKVMPSRVTVRVGTSSGTSIGSGFIVSADGYVLTNDHVVEGGKGTATVVFSDASNGSAKVVGVDQESDVAVLKVDRNGLPPVQFGDSEQVAVGDPVLAFGSPLALTNTVTYGIVSALDPAIQADEPSGPTPYYAAIQTDAAVNHGNSGGPLVNAAGLVIGMNSVIQSIGSDSETAGNIGLAFAIPIDQARPVAQDIVDTGHARRTVIGAQLSASYQNPNGGVEITPVTAGGPAANAGLKAGDVVMKLQGVPLQESGELMP